MGTFWIVVIDIAVNNVFSLQPTIPYSRNELGMCGQTRANRDSFRNDLNRNYSLPDAPPA